VASTSKTDGRGANIGRLVGIWSAVEGVAILLAVNLCRNLGAPDAVIPAIAIIVGLHFFPLARGIPVRLYYLTGTAMVAVGAAALLVPMPGRLLATGLGCAAVLWLSCGVLVLRAPRRA
jgi:hypothetical protein